MSYSFSSYASSMRSNYNAGHNKSINIVMSGEYSEGHDPTQNLGPSLYFEGNFKPSFNYITPEFNNQIQLVNSGGYRKRISYISPSETYSLDAVVEKEHVHFSKEDQKKSVWYSPKQYLKGLYLDHKKPEYHILVEDFLKSDRPLTAWVASLSSELREHISEAFKATTGDTFPFEKVEIHVLDDKEFRKAHEQFDGAWDEGIRGFSINRQGKGTDHIFIRNDFLDAMMLTMGHEVGHLMSKTLTNQHDEEAKAFAFSMAWMKAIVENNIAGLQQCINPNPARNGLHDTAFDFVHKFIQQGMFAIDVFRQIITGELSFEKQLETITIS